MSMKCELFFSILDARGISYTTCYTYVKFGWRPTPFISNDVLPPVVLKSNTNY